MAGSLMVKLGLKTKLIRQGGPKTTLLTDGTKAKPDAQTPERKKAKAKRKKKNPPGGDRRPVDTRLV